MLTLAKPLREKEAATALVIDQTMRAKLPVLANPIVASWHEGHRLVISRGAPWIIGPLEADPYVTNEGGYPLPAAVAAQLQRISAAGARFHRIAIAHEVEPSGAAAALLPELTGRGRPVTTAQARACLGEAPAAEKPKALAALMDNVIRKAGTGLTGVASAAAGALAAPMLDPIVFGVIAVTGQPQIDRPALYYPLAAWVW